MDKLDTLPSAGVPVPDSYTYKNHGGRYISAFWNHLCVIATFDPDGQCEVSFSTVDGHKPNDGPINAFFKWWGCRPLSETKGMKRCRHFIVRYGMVH